MPTENRSSNTEMVSVPEGYMLVERSIWTEKQCDAAAACITRLKVVPGMTDRDLAMAAMDAAQCTAPDIALSDLMPAPQPHPEPIAWMVGTAFWWTKEEAERDASATGLPIVGLGPMSCAAPAEQHQGEPVFILAEPIAPWFYFADCADPDYSGLFNHESEALTQVNDHGGQVVKLWNVPPCADPGEVERLRAALESACNLAHSRTVERDTLRAQLAERDVLPQFAQTVIRKLKRFRDCAEDGQGADIGKTWFDVLVELGLLNRVQRSPAWWEITDEGDALLDGRAALSASAKPSAPGVLPRAHDVNMFQRTAKREAKS